MLVNAVRNREPTIHDVTNPNADGGRARSQDDFINGPQVYPSVAPPQDSVTTPPADHSEAIQSAQQAGQEIQSALSVTATPVIDAGPIQAALTLVRQLRSELDGLGGTVRRKTADLETQLNRSFSDHPLAP